MPHALRIAADTGAILGTDRSRPQQLDGTAGAGWVFVTPEQYQQALTTPDPAWVDGAVVSLPYPEPTLDALRAAALARYQSEAADCLRRGLPEPWDTLRDVATPEFRAWADELCAAVAAELSRLEAAVAGAADAAALALIVADWPEVV